MDQFAFNGTIYGPNSHIIRIDAVSLTGVRSLSFSDARTRALVFGSKRDGTPLGKTAGQYNPGEASLKVLRATADQITTYLTPIGAGSYGDASFTLLVQVIEPDSTAAPQTTVLSSCHITGVSEDYNNTDEVSETTFTIQPESISRNGKVLYSLVRKLTV